MPDIRVGTTADLPDEYGLSSDSLRGSHQFIQPHLVDSDGIDPLTGRPNPRVSLSRNEVRALENVGILVDENGYEREPEPVVAVAPIPTVKPRVRPADRAPADETKPDPHLQVPVDDEGPHPYDPQPLPSNVTPSPPAPSPLPTVTESPTSPVPPYSGDAATYSPSETTEGKG
jgi:hypothetical protein